MVACLFFKEFNCDVNCKNACIMVNKIILQFTWQLKQERKEDKTMNRKKRVISRMIGLFSVHAFLTTVILISLLFALPVMAADYYTEGFFKYSIVNQEYISIHSYYGTEKEVVIPDSIAGLPVLCIEAKAFYGNSAAQKITIPYTVREIGEDAFGNMPALKEIVTQSEEVSDKVSDSLEDNKPKPDPEEQEPEQSHEVESPENSTEESKNEQPESKDVVVKVEEPENTPFSQDQLNQIEIAEEYEEEEDEQKRIDVPGMKDTYITVDENKHLIIENADEGVVLDDSQKYAISEDQDGNIRITDEKGNPVVVDEKGEIHFSNREGDEIAENASNLISSDSEIVTTGMDDMGKKQSSRYLLWIAFGVVLVVLAGAGIVFWRKKRK